MAHKTKLMKSTADNAVVDGIAMLMELQQEAQEIADGAEGSGRAATPFVMQMAENAENLPTNEPDVPGEAEDIKVQWTEELPTKSWGREHLSREKRCSNALARLQAALDALSRHDFPEGDETDEQPMFDDLCNELEEIIANAENTSWPSMRG